MKPFKHYILTRFNLGCYNPDGPYTQWVGDPDEWMRHRVALFERFTWRFMQHQTCKDFTWVLAFDEQTPAAIISKYDYCDRIQVVYEQPHLWLRSQPPESDWLLTSRLDNDDYYYCRFVQSVHGSFAGVAEVIDVMYLQRQLSDNTWHDPRRPRPNSPFLSLYEPWGENVKTALGRPHTYMVDEFPARRIEKVLAVQVIHDRNVANKVND